MHRVPRSLRRLPLRAAPLAGALVGLAAPLVFASRALAAEAVPPPPASLLDVFGGWSFDLSIQLPIALSALAYVWAFRRVNRAHPANPVPVRRLVAWLAGLAALEIALQSSIDEYEGVLFTVHMLQHMVLVFAAAPALVLGGPVTLALRVATPGVRKRILLPALHSRLLRFLAFPVVAWVLFAAAMWGTHFSPVFDASLRDPLVHDGEHLLYVLTGVLFWWPVAGVDPGPWRMPYPGRIGYLFLQMPQNSFLGLAIYSATSPLYEAYANSGRSWGPSPLSDQQLAGGIMWVGGDFVFLIAVLLMVAAWAASEDREAARIDAHLDAELERRRRRELAWAGGSADFRGAGQVDDVRAPRADDASGPACAAGVKRGVDAADSADSADAPDAAHAS